MINRWILGGVLCIGVFRILFSRLWSRSAINFLPYRYSLNFEQVKTIANVSLSQKQHFFSAEVHHLDLKIIGCQSALKYDVMCSHFVPRFLWLPSRVLILVSNSSNVPIKDKSVWRIKLVHLLNDFCWFVDSEVWWLTIMIHASRVDTATLIHLNPTSEIMLCSGNQTLMHKSIYEWINLRKIILLNLSESKAEWQCNISMTKYRKYEWNGLWSIKSMRWTMVDEVNETDYERWN